MAVVAASLLPWLSFLAGPLLRATGLESIGADSYVTPIGVFAFLGVPRILGGLLEWLPLAAVALAGLLLLLMVFRRQGGLVSQATVLALLPLGMMVTHLALGPTRTFSQQIFAVHFLQFLAFSLPPIGMFLDYTRLLRGTELVRELRLAQAKLLERTMDLENANLELAQQNEIRTITEQALKRSESIKARVLDGALEGIFSFDESGRIIDFNRATDEIFEFKRRGVDFMRLLEVSALLPPRYRRRYLHRSALGELPLGRRLQIRGLRADGSEFPMELALTPIRLGNQTLYSAYVRDITQRQRYKQDLIDAREEAIRASLAKTEFLANMSHEIRTPLNAIIGMTDLLAETPLAEDQERYLRICRRAGRTLLNIVNDVLDLSKIEFGHIEVERVDFDVHALIEGVAEMMAVRAHEKGLNLALHIGSSVSRVLRGDLNRIRQILLNLIGNAVKFTRSGEVTIRVERDLGPSAAQETIAFVIRDTGIGIPDAQLARIFDRFTQADSSVTRVHGGTGLGLAICKRLVDAMGGEIHVRSRIGEGSEFTVKVPLEIPSRVALVKARDYFFSLEGKQVLIACDSDSTRVVLSDLIGGWGGYVSEARDGSEAMEVMRAAMERGGGPIEIVFINDLLPDVSGWDLAASIAKTDFGFKASTVVLTEDARVFTSDRLRARHVAAVVGKPVKRSGLMEAVAKCLGKTVPKQMQLAEQVYLKTANETSKEGGRILLVEDSSDNQALIRAYVRAENISLDVAWNGEEACEKFKYGAYDLVFMDMQMPVMDGYSATRKIREFESDSGRPKTPILALTAHALTEEIKKSLDAGCDGHLAKPVRKQQLLETIQLFTKGVDDAGGTIERRIADNMGRETRQGSRRPDPVIHAEQAE